MSTNQRPLYGFRFVEIRHGDTLQSIAARELGDASRWAELIAYNDLVPPYVTDDASAAVNGVLLSGNLIRLPAPVPVVSTTSNPDQVFQSDIELDAAGGLALKDGDFAVVSGRTNLRQALKHRVETDRGELIFHSTYGSLVRRLIGSVNGPTATLLAAQYAKSAVQADPRIKQVTQAEAEAIGDTIRVSIEAEPVVGRVVELSADL
jgi:phage baseplate assembly protein W